MPSGVLRNRNFLFYAGGNAVSWTGVWMQRTGIGWLSWDLTHSPSWVGIIALAQYLPLIFFGPFFGVVLDRVDRKRYAMGVQLLSFTLGLSIFVLEAVGLLSIYVLLSMCLAIGCVNSAYQPVRLTLVNDVVPRALLTQAIGTNSMLFNTTRLIGPALGGLAIVSLGVAYTFLLCALTYVVNVSTLAAMKIQSTAKAATSGGLLEQFTAGLRYTLASQTVRELMVLSMITSILARGVLELLPAFAGGEFHTGSVGLAMLMSASGAGSIAAGFLLSRAQEEKLAALVRYGCTWSGIGVATFSLVGFYPGALAVAVVLGTLVTLSSVGLQAILQTKIDGEYRGRVVGFWGVTNVAGPSLGGALLGGLAQATGLRSATFMSGVLCALLCFVVLRKSSLFARPSIAVGS